jgi:hypothetical protein
MQERELPIIQRAYDLILWYIPRISNFPRDHKFVLGDRMQSLLYALLEGLVRARYASDKRQTLELLNADLEVLRYQTRLCKDLGLMDVRRYEYASRCVNELGGELGAWLRQHRRRDTGGGA